MRVVIGLAGVKTSGKSTVASIIKDLVGGNVSESALAGKLKDVCVEVFGLTRDDFDNQNVKEVPFENPRLLDHERIVEILEKFNVEPTDELMQTYYTNNIEGMVLETPRKIAQIVGTEVLRATGDADIHCKNMPMNENGITIVSDLRFPNEFQYFLNAKGVKFIPLYVQRDAAEAFVTKDSHPSETSVFKFSEKCQRIPNNSSLEDLKMVLSATLEVNGLIEEDTIWD